MTTGDSPQGIKITLDDLANVRIAETAPQPIAPAVAGSRSYGTISEASGQAPAVEQERGSLFLRGWFYLGAAGLLGALAGWAICEPGFVDDARRDRWGNLLLMPVLVALMTLAFGIAESVVERSRQKALIRTAL